MNAPVSKTQEKSDLPTVEHLLIKASLYAPVQRANGWGEFIHTLRWGRFQFDAHCVSCGSTATFKSNHQSMYAAAVTEAVKPAYFNRAIICTRNENHHYSYEFLLSADEVQKIGQYPSIEDIIGSDLKRYSAVLAKEDYTELRRATGLFSHGIGIGSFVYLRRIFERMIYRHRSLQDAAGGKPIDAFEKKRMDEKIGALASVLPPALVKNKAVYAILSKGIHELGEEECRKCFPVVRAAIIQILEQDLEAKERQKAEHDLEKEIARIHGEVI